MHFLSLATLLAILDKLSTMHYEQDTAFADDAIDLCTPILHVDHKWLAARAMHRFPRLRERIAILPLFPCMDNDLEQCCPLQANVPRT